MGVLSSLGVGLLGAGTVSAAATVAAPGGGAFPGSAPYVPGVVVVGYRTHSIAAAADGGGPARISSSVRTTLVRLRRGTTVNAEIERLRRRHDVAYAVPDYMAHMAGASIPGWIPNDPGNSHAAQGWEKMQWNFLPGTGVDAPEAWANLFAEHHPGGRGVTVAVLDTGVAYRNWRQFRRSPDFSGTRFVDPYDFVDHNRFPLDREGHGTFVAGTIAETTNNRYGLTGLAYGASIMPVRILGTDGWGDAQTIADGIRYAVEHHAQVINLSLEFDPTVSAGDIPQIISALEFAHRRGVVVVASSGNEGVQRIDYPARSPDVISVGATTSDGCLAGYSNGGAKLDLVAPGGGDDASLNQSNCQPQRNLPSIYQMTFGDPTEPGKFGYPGDWFGTSMSAPHVAATAALVIASGLLGRHPTPAQVLARLEATAQTLGGSKPNPYYGFGLVNAGAATAPAAPIGATGPSGPTGSGG